jgi:hypothetical protein
MGDLWCTVYLSVQDAIALGTLLKLPGLLGHIIIGKDFATFDVCVKESPLGIMFYACYIIIASDFCLWILLVGRIISRFLVDFGKLKGSMHDSKKP